MGKYALAVTHIDKMIMHERKRACKIVRENCVTCDGSGIGGLEMDANDTPVGTIECEYCGPVIHEIMGE